MTDLPPHNLNAEESLLGAMMLSGDAVADAVEVLDAGHFYKPAHGHIFQAIVDQFNAGEKLDPITVGALLDSRKLLDAVGGQAELIGLMTKAPAVSNAGRYARIVEELATLRQLISVAGEMIDLARGLPEDVDGALDEADRLLLELRGRRRGSNGVSEVREVLERSLERMEELYEAGQPITGLRTGYLDLDEILGGLQPGALYVVGARPAMGKTSFALGAALNIALHGNVLFYTLEMSEIEIGDRILASEAQVDLTRIRSGRLTDTDWEKIAYACGKERHMFIDDNPFVKVSTMRAQAQRIKQKVGLDAIFVDYVQLMGGDDKRRENRQVEVSEISRGLKILARDIGVPVVALAQLNRSLEQRADKRPILSDLRESGALEQDANVVMFLYRDEVYHHDTEDVGIAEVSVAKNRSGPTGLVRMAFLGNRTRWVNMATAA